MFNFDKKAFPSIYFERVTESESTSSVTLELDESISNATTPVEMFLFRNKLMITFISKCHNQHQHATALFKLICKECQQVSICNALQFKCIAP